MSLVLPMPPYEWQNDIWQRFVSGVDRNRLSHAYLLLGQDGVGAELLALAMGQYLLCSAPDNNMACAKCRNCQLLQSNSHPDILTIQIEEKASQIKVDQIRKITEFVAKTAQQGGRKIVYLQPAEAMNVNAANALLKNLEEPAGDTVFLLVSAQSNRLLPTIKSRCMLIDIPIPEKEMAESWLKALGIDDASNLLLEAGGAPLKVKHWIDHHLIDERNLVVDSLTKLTQGECSPVSLAKTLSKVPPALLVEIMLLVISSAVKSSMAKESVPNKLSCAVQLLSQKPDHLLFRLYDRVSQKKKEIEGSSNLNVLLVLEEILLDWESIARFRASR